MANLSLVSETRYLDELTSEKPPIEFKNGFASQQPFRLKRQGDVSHVVLDAPLALDRSGRGYCAWSATTDLSSGEDRWYAVPDLSFWMPGRPVARDDGVFLPPNLAVELVYRESDVDALRDKCREYLSRGVDVAWLIDPRNRTVEVIEGDLNPITLPPDGVLETEHVPGLRIPVANLWTEV